MEYTFYHVPEKKLNYYVGPNPICKKCDYECEKAFILTFNTFRMKEAKAMDRIECYCMNCKDFAAKQYNMFMGFNNGSYYNIFMIVDKVPPKSCIYDISAITGFNRTPNMTVFTAALQQGQERVNDLTVHAGKTSLEGAQIGKLPEEVPQKEMILNNVEVDALLEFHASAPAALEASPKVKLLNNTEAEDATKKE